MKRRRKRRPEPFAPADVLRVVFWKKDLLTTDLICCQISLRSGLDLILDEDDEWWAEVLGQLSLIEGFDADWFAKVIQPPFAESLYVAYAYPAP